MNTLLKTKWLRSGLLLAAVGLGLSSCVDSSYDLNKDIDMTMGLGSDGLSLKLGATERIMLGDLLETDKEEMLDETSEGLFYLVRKGVTDFTFDIPNVTTHVDEVHLTPETELINIDKGIGSQGGTERKFKAGDLFTPHVTTKASDKLKLNLTSIPKEVSRVKSIKPDQSTAQFRMKMRLLTNPGSEQDFRIASIKNMKVHFPQFVNSGSLVDGVVSVPDQAVNNDEVDLGAVVVSALELMGDLGQEAQEANGEKFISLVEDISMEADISLEAASDFTMAAGDYTNVCMDIVLDGPRENGQVAVNVDEFTGCFDPEINPEIDPIQIGESLPDFLRDEEVRVSTNNSTLKINVDMSDIPASIQFSGNLQSVLNSRPQATVQVPAQGESEVSKAQPNVIYFYEGNAPFDPNGVEPGSKSYFVDNISDLITPLPDQININFGAGDVHLKKDELSTIRLNSEYKADVDYEIFVPFTFDAGLCIVYNDSVDNMNKDLKDYSAEGAQVSAEIASTIPLELMATLIPVGVDGKEVPSIHVDKAYVEPAPGDGSEKVTNVVLTLTFDSPEDLKLLDKLRFRIAAESTAANGALTSDQYLQVRNMRLKLMGQIVADFN